ncbi:MAG: dipicolinate synthase subunit B [Faecousia sp.]
MKDLVIGFALCGSFCTYQKAMASLEKVAAAYKTVIPIFSQSGWETDTRFGDAVQHIRRAEEICGTAALHTVAQVEPIGPKKLLDALVVAPCTGNTLAKLAHGIADGPVTMAAKSHLRNGRPIVLAVSTNDGLGAAAENIGRLLARKHIFFVPFGQDAPEKKPTSLVADFEKLPQALELALEEKQLQPLLISV